MARDLSKYTAEQQEAIRAQRRDRAARRRKGKTEATAPVTVTKPPRERKGKPQPERELVRVASGYGLDRYDTSHEDAILAEYGF